MSQIGFGKQHISLRLLPKRKAQGSCKNRCWGSSRLIALSFVLRSFVVHRRNRQCKGRDREGKRTLPWTTQQQLLGLSVPSRLTKLTIPLTSAASLAIHLVGHLWETAEWCPEFLLATPSCNLQYRTQMAAAQNWHPLSLRVSGAPQWDTDWPAKERNPS